MAQKLPFPPDYVDQLARFLYTPERIDRATYYAASRGLDASTLRVPWAMTESHPGAFEFLRQWGQPPSLYVDCLFIPIVEMRHDPAETGRPVLSGFDIRYCGPRARAKYTKVKRDASSVMLYNVHEPLWSDWVVLVESAIDVESLRAIQLPAEPGEEPRNLPVLGSLTANGSPQFTMLLHGLFERVYIMYDNDKGGGDATRKMLESAERAGPKVRDAFRPLVYQGDDPNRALQLFGRNFLAETIVQQVR